MRHLILCLINLFPLFTIIACDSDKDYILDEIEIKQKRNELLEEFNNNPANICVVNDRYDVIDFSLFMKQSSSGSVQGCACYDGYLFQFRNGLKNVFIYNLETKQLKKILDYDLQSLYHCNNANFSTTFYSKEDLFPLLYVSQQNNNVHQTFVYRLVGDSIDNIGLNLIQTITGPTPTTDNHMYYQDCIIDGDNGYIYLYAHHKRDEKDSFHIVKYKLPDISNPNIQLTDSDLLGSVFYDNQFCSPQGAVYHDGLLFFIKGVPQWKEQVLLEIVNFEDREVCSINMTEKGFKNEPEGICFFGDNLICATNGNGFYSLNLN